jgi:hypothetical protein
MYEITENRFPVNPKMLLRPREKHENEFIATDFPPSDGFREMNPHDLDRQEGEDLQVRK